MVDFVDPYSSLASGIERGATLALNIDKVKREQSDRTKELSLKAADSKLELARSFKGDKKRMMSLISSAAEDYKKAGVNVPDIDPTSLTGDDASKKLSDALNLWHKNTSSGVWDAEFGRKWLITKVPEISLEGGEFNALTEHAYKEALKSQKEVSGESPTDIKGRLMGKYLTGGLESLSPQERTIMEPELQDPNLRQAQSVYLADPRNMIKPTDEKVREIQEIAKTLKASSEQKPKSAQLIDAISKKYGQGIGTAFQEDWKKAMQFADEGASEEEIIESLSKKYAKYPDIVKAIKNSRKRE